jgi:general secretion pathway protein G
MYMLRKPRTRRRQAFTLMEVLLVVAILIILASLATFSITRAYRGARVNAAKLDINTISQTLQAYYIDIGTYPQDLQGLVTMPDGLANPTKWNGPYLTNGLPQDPWGGEYKYSVQGEEYVISSAGPDAIENNEDDVTSATP